MKRPIRTLAALTLLTAPAGAVPQELEPDSGIAVHDLSGLLRDIDAGVDGVRLIPPFDDLSSTPRPGSHSNRERVSIGALQELLVRLHDEALRYRDAEERSPMITTMGEDRLVVRGTSELRESVASSLAAVDALLGHTSKLRLRWYSAAPGGFGELPAQAAITGTELARLVEGNRGTLMHEVAFDLRLGSTGRLDLRSPATMVVDYDVEIATHASIVDPVVAQVCTGPQVVARYTPSGSGGHLALIATLADNVGERRDSEIEMRAVYSGGDGSEAVNFQPLPLTLQHQDVVTRGIGLSAFVPEGRVLVCRTRWDLPGTGGDELLAIDVQSPSLDLVQSIDAASSQVLCVLRDAISRPRVGAWTDGDAPMLSGARWLHDWSFSGRIVADGGDADFDLIPDAGRGWEALGPWLAAMPGRALDGAATRAAAEALAPGVGASGRATAVARQGGQMVASFDLPIDDGADCFAFVALTSPRVLDIDVEVATGSGIGDPSVGTVEEGCAVVLSPARHADGTWSLSPTAEVSVRTGPVERVSMNLAPGGWVELVPTARLWLETDVQLPPGNARSLGPEGSLSLAVGLR